MSKTSLRWIPLESNPAVLNSWSEEAGLAEVHQFSDVYGLDDGLLGMVPQPSKAIVLLFPISEQSEEKRAAEDKEIEEKGQPVVDPTIVFIKQTIPNACGTMGLIHAIANSDVTIAPGSALSKFIDECMDKNPDDRAQLLESTPHFTEIHAQAASEGQTAVPTNLKTNLHFTCFVSAPSPDGSGQQRVIELDGRRAGPIDRGECTDLLKDVAKIVKEVYIEGGGGSLEFSMLSLGPREGSEKES
ncbi:Ubiquitin carboxyl-terminal hydrolase [Mycena kentingensis (nom. inval.)]|nr:Ubiquitin carboxyl-terminal hydrolase [Mycena kentingensis (nom. inval.)]